MLELHGQRLPAARRRALELPCVRFPNDAEMLLEVRNHFFDDRVTVWTIIRRVHRIRIGEVRCLLKQTDGDHARKAVRTPGLVGLVAVLEARDWTDATATTGRRRIRGERQRSPTVAECVD